MLASLARWQNHAISFAIIMKNQYTDNFLLIMNSRNIHSREGMQQPE